VNEKIFILSAGRTGSHYLIDLFRQHGAMPLWLERNNLDSNYFIRDHASTYPQHDIVIHGHVITEEIKTISSEIDLVLNLRRDVFTQAISMIIAQDSKNYMSYENQVSRQQIEFKTLKETLLGIHLANVEYINECNLLNWKSTRIYYYEDLLQKPSNFLKNQFKLEGVDFVKHERICEKSPYDYKKLIENYDQIFKQYRKWYKSNKTILDYPKLKSC